MLHEHMRSPYISGLADTKFTCRSSLRIQYFHLFLIHVMDMVLVEGVDVVFLIMAEAIEMAVHTLVEGMTCQMM